MTSTTCDNMDCEGVTLSEISQAHVLSLVCATQNNKANGPEPVEAENSSVVA